MSINWEPEEDGLDYVPEEDFLATCPVCEGHGLFLGVLGSLAHYRCTCCGMDFNRKVNNHG